ncbi:MAG: CoA transferase [Deltaproteobacteria bacterium]|nr:CoA transferase [Deltaproteobacteria bacterium]
MAKNSTGPGWLAGVTVLDLSSLLPSPFAAHLLAKFGARVIKVESPNRPDPAREFGYVPPGKTGSCYREINDNKELLLLDLKSETDRERLYELVRTADGAIEGYRPDVRKRLGIEYETLAALNPALVYCSVGGYDPAGDYRDRAGHDLNFVARSGILDQTRDREGRCVMPGIPLGDYSVAYAAALRMACALFGARQSRRGCHIEITIEQALLEVQMPFLREAIESGEMPRSGHTLVTGKYPCYNLYEVEGGTFALGALEEKFWRVFCESIGRADLISSHLATGDAGQRTIAEVNKTLSRKNFADWWKIFRAVDCCIEPVVAVKDVVNGLQS